MGSEGISRGVSSLSHDKIDVAKTGEIISGNERKDISRDFVRASSAPSIPIAIDRAISYVNRTSIPEELKSRS